ncbi:MAG: hypothetical protein O7C75_08305 [Verrucomicrobia bacterium]|nr:hypothetical protein [Verrucomicrobiota bacterium]
MNSTIISTIRVFFVLLGGALYSSADELKWQWELQDGGVITSIRALCAVDEKVCWFGTGNGMIGRTTDGGKSWERFVVPGAEDLEFRDVEAFDKNRCVAMSVGEGTSSRIYLTADGGQSWKLVFQNTALEGFFDGIAFWDRENGVLAGDPVEGRLFILRTKDGGKTWKPLDARIAPKMESGEHAFAASGTHLSLVAGGHLWVGSGGKVARIFYSYDFGESWTTLETPMILGEASTGIFSIAFKNPNEGIVVGGDYTKEEEGDHNAMLTVDGGRTWKLLNKSNGNSVFPFRSCVRYAPDLKTVIAVGPEGGNVSSDGGKSWREFGDQGFHTLSIGGSLNAVWAAGTDGRIAHLR